MATATSSSPATRSASADGARPDGPSRTRPPLEARANRWLEALTRGLERSGVLGSAGKAISAPVTKLLPAGPVKDLLSGTWLGHPAHPMLTDVPIGVWTSAAVLDLVETFGGASATTRRGSDTLVGLGVLAALPTAAAGLSDLSDEVEEPVLAAGAAHALGSLGATGLFAVSYLARRRGKRAQGIALSLIGTGLLTAASFLGGHLSYRRGLGVDHTVFEEPVAEWTAVLDATELAEGKPRSVTVGEQPIMLYRSNGTIYALANRCSHRGGPLHEGEIENQEVVCPWHFSRFSLHDGSVIRGPAVAPQPCYETRVRQGKIEVRSQG